jgi:hypothetical protein
VVGRLAVAAKTDQTPRFAAQSTLRPKSGRSMFGTIQVTGNHLAMIVMSITEFKRNKAATLAMVEAGQVINISRRGRIIVEICPPTKKWVTTTEQTG